MYTDLPEEAQNASGFRGAWRVVIAGDHDDLCVRQLVTQRHERTIRVQDRGVGRTHRVKDVTADHDHIG